MRFKLTYRDGSSHMIIQPPNFLSINWNEVQRLEREEVMQDDPLMIQFRNADGIVRIIRDQWDIYLKRHSTSPKIDMIKFMRNLTGCGLKEGKDFVDKWMPYMTSIQD